MLSDASPPVQKPRHIEPPPTSLRDWIVVFIIVMAATLPFLNKAIHIDDVLYLRGAQQILRTPLDPYKGLVLWDAEDGQPAPLFEIDYNPPLWKYVLAGVVRFAGWDEWKLHLAESVCVWIGGAGLFRLGRRFSPYPLWSTAVILLGPFFLPGQNLMLEGPLLAFLAWGIEFECLSWQTDKNRWSWLAGICLAGAVLTKYTAGVIIPIIWFGSLWLGRKRITAGLPVILVPALAVAGLVAHSFWLYRKSHLGAHGFALGLAMIPIRFLIVLRCIGAVVLFGPVVVVLLWRLEKVGRIALAAVFGMSALLAAADVMQAIGFADTEGWSPTALQKVHYAAFTFQGALCILGLFAAVAIAVRDAQFTERLPNPRAAGFLLLFVVVLLAFNIACVPFNAIRHLQWLLIPLTWLAAEGLALDSALLRRSVAAASIAVGTALAVADCQFANAYRELSKTIVKRYGPSGKTVWITGNWGFYYYAVQAGGRPLIRNPEEYGLPSIMPGDFVITPRLLTWKPYFLPPPVKGQRLIDHIQPENSNPFRTIAPGVHYYAILRHALPWEILVADAREMGGWVRFMPLDDVLIYELE